MDRVEEVQSGSAAETFALGMRLAQSAAAGQIYCLDGDLGAGKTVFTKGFARGLGITQTVNSPTFTILKIYTSGRLDLYHFDVYRIDSEDEMEEIGWEDYVYSDGVTLVEWASRIEGLIPESAVRIRIETEPEKGDSLRRIIFSGNTAALQRVIEEAADACAGN